MKWFEIFRTGTHTDSKGNTRDWTKEELEEIAQKYNAAGNEAPIVIGHPKDNSPAFGWVKSLKLAGEKLLALPSKIMPEFVEAVQKGLYRHRSISLNGDGSLRHVGFLGGTPPAVKGLADVQFNEGEDVQVFEFAEEEETSPPAPLLEKERGAGEGLEGRQEQDAPSKPVIDPDKQREEPVRQFTEQEYNEVDQRRQQAEDELRNLRMRIRKAEFESFLNEQIAYGNVTPAMKPKLEQLLEVVGSVDMQETDALGQPVYNFSDGTKANPVAVFKEFVKGLPKVIEFKEIARKPEEAAKVITSPREAAEEEIRKSMYNVQ